MLNIFVVFLLSAIEALILPPGFIIEKFPKARQFDTIKIKENIALGEKALTFSETLWFKRPNKFRLYVEKDGDAILFIREGNNCVALTSSKQIAVKNLCSNSENNFFYRLLLPYKSYIEFTEQLGVSFDKKHKELQLIDEKYVDPEGIQLLRYKNRPVYVLGLDGSDYNSAVSSAKSGSSSTGDKLIEEIKNETPQIWIEKKNYYPVRIYGSFPQYDGGNSKRQLILKSYSEDANNIPFPSVIELMDDDNVLLSYGVVGFETRIRLNDSLFDVVSYKGRFKKSVSESELPETKKKLLDYLRKYR